MKRLYKPKITALWGLVLAAGSLFANNLQISNVTVGKRNDHTAYVNFDITWENSWRYTNVNHDAAWVVFKVRQESGTK